MPNIMDMFGQMQRGKDPTQPGQTPSTLQPMAATPEMRGMSGIAQSVMGQMQPQGAPAGV
jgi:hypothetical protein